MKTIKELIKMGFEETFVSEEESGDFPFSYLSYKTRHEVHLISDDYHPNTDRDVKIKIFFLDGNQEELSDELLEQLV
jgi:hypothetical protein